MFYLAAKRTEIRAERPTIEFCKFEGFFLTLRFLLKCLEVIVISQGVVESPSIFHIILRHVLQLISINFLLVKMTPYTKEKNALGNPWFMIPLKALLSL